MTRLNMNTPNNKTKTFILPDSDNCSTNENHYHNYSTKAGNESVGRDETGDSLTPSDQETLEIASGIDWLTVTFDFPNQELFDQFLKGIYKDEPYCHLELPCKLSADKYYPYSLRSQLSADGGYSVQKDDEGGDKKKHRDQVRGGYEIDSWHGNYVGFIQLKGKYWERMLPDEQIQIISHCEYYQCSYSRIDLRLDDWSYTLIPFEQMYFDCYKNPKKEGKSPDIAGFKKAGYREEDDKWCFTFGGRKSESFWRGYNHDWGEEEKFAKRESYRLERELKGKKAKEAVKMIANLKPKTGEKPNQGLWEGMIQIDVGDRVYAKPEDDGWGEVKRWDESNECFEVELETGKVEVYYPNQLTPTTKPKTWNEQISDVFCQMVIGNLDFVNKSEKTGERINKGDCKRLPFWQDFLDKVGEGIKLIVSRKRWSVEDNRNWLEKQVAPTLAIYYEGLGEAGFMEFFSYLIAYGKEKWKDKHEMMARAVESDFEKMGYI